MPRALSPGRRSPPTAGWRRPSTYMVVRSETGSTSGRSAPNSGGDVMAGQLAPVSLRQMNAGDFAAATEVWRDAFATTTEFPQSTTPPTASELAAGIARRAHLLRHDPGGSFVAEADDGVVGFAQSHRREGTFVL